MSISVAFLSLLLTGPTIPANGWLDRVEAACPTYKCTLSALTEKKQRGAACTTDLRESPAEKSGWLQGFSSDLFGWDEYIPLPVTHVSA